MSIKIKANEARPGDWYCGVQIQAVDAGRLVTILYMDDKTIPFMNTDDLIVDRVE